MKEKFIVSLSFCLFIFIEINEEVDLRLEGVGGRHCREKFECLRELKQYPVRSPMILIHIYTEDRLQARTGSVRYIYCKLQNCKVRKGNSEYKGESVNVRVF